MKFEVRRKLKQSNFSKNENKIIVILRNISRNIQTGESRIQIGEQNTTDYKISI